MLELADGYWDLPEGKIASVVTYLEMHEPPAAADGLIAPPGWTVERIAEPQLDWYRGMFRAVGQEWLWFSRLRMSDEELASTLGSPAVDVVVARFEGTDAGLIELNWHSGSDAELEIFGVLPSMTGKGAGRYLMRYAIDYVFGRGARRFHLHTCTLDHPGALAFYRKAGFRPFKRAIEIDTDPRVSGDLPRDCAPSIPLID